MMRDHMMGWAGLLQASGEYPTHRTPVKWKPKPKMVTRECLRASDLQLPKRMQSDEVKAPAPIPAPATNKPDWRVRVGSIIRSRVGDDWEVISINIHKDSFVLRRKGDKALFEVTATVHMEHIDSGAYVSITHPLTNFPS
jgi:hypothetical protein